MTFVRVALLMLAALALPMAAGAEDKDIVVQGDAARAEIERILSNDNVDTTQMDATEVVEAISTIRRGRAPEDFWTAYRAHVAAWERLAKAQQAMGARLDDSRFESSAEVEQAERAIESTFDEVERLARKYGAHMPVPPAELRTIA